MARKRRNTTKAEVPVEDVSNEELEEVTSTEEIPTGDGTDDSDGVPAEDSVSDDSTDAEVPVVGSVIPDETSIPEESTVVEKPVIEVPKVDGKLYKKDIKELLKKKGIPMAEKLDIISKNGVPEFANVVSRMKDYQEVMSKKAPLLTAKEGAKKNYTLFTALRSAISTEDYEDFKIKFTMINAMFLRYQDDSFDDNMLHRYYKVWTWGDKALKTYQYLITLINVLADNKTRKDRLDVTIKLDKALDPKTTLFTPKMIDNIKKFYQS